MDCVCSFDYARKLLPMETSKKTKEIKKTENCTKNREKKGNKENQLFLARVKLLPWNLYFSLAVTDVKYYNKEGNEDKRNRDFEITIHNAVMGDKYTLRLTN